MTRLMRDHKFPRPYSPRLYPFYIQWETVDISKCSEHLRRAKDEVVAYIGLSEKNNTNLRACVCAMTLTVEADVILLSGGFND